MDRSENAMADDLVRRLGHLTLGTRLKRIGERLQGDVTRLSARLGLDVAAGQYPLLAVLAGTEAASIGALARRVGVSQPAITRSVAQLEAAGLVATAVDPADQRARVVRLTEAGRSLVDRAERDLWPAIEAAVRRLCADLDGPLLDQLDALEDALAERPLDARARDLLPETEPRR